MTTAKRIRELADKATTRPWTLEANKTNQVSGNNWGVACGLGRSEEDGKYYAITTDAIRGSELHGDPKWDAELITYLVNRAEAIADLIEACEKHMDGGWGDSLPTCGGYHGDGVPCPIAVALRRLEETKDR